jgi:hypothetical protein
MPQIRGAFPLPVSNLFEGMGRVTLNSGAVFYFPSGNYIISTDANSIIEVWDPVETVWRTWITASNSESVYCDGYNFRARNTTGALTTTTITGAGSALTNGIGPLATGVTLTVSGGTQTTGFPVPQLYAIVGGSVTAPTITRAGSGFISTPTIVIDAPPTGGIQAAAIATLTAAGGIAAITMVNVGAGYQTTPQFWIIPQATNYQGAPPGGPNSGLAAAPINPPGLVDPSNIPPNVNANADSVNGAKLTSNALTGSGTLTGVGVINFGGGYQTTAPTVNVAVASGTAPTVTMTIGAGSATATIRSQPRVQ